jgi:hypothetical protein
MKFEIISNSFEKKATSVWSALVWKIHQIFSIYAWNNRIVREGNNIYFFTELNDTKTFIFYT